MSVDDRPRRHPTLPAVHEAWLPREHALHRPRHGGRQLVALVCALIFFVTPGLCWALGARPTEIENRPIAAFPSPSAGWGFFTGLAQWATDHLVFRGAAVQAEDGLSRSVFGEPAPFDRGGNQQGGPLAGTPGENGPSPSDATGGDHAGFPTVIQGKDGWLYFGQDVASKCQPARPLDATIQTLQRLRRAVEDSGRKFVLLVPPDKTTMVPQYLPDSYAGKECAQRASAEFWRRITTEAGAVDLRPMLQEAAARVGRPVYYPQDTHWTDEGAMMLAADLAEHLQPGVTRTWATHQQPQEYAAPSDLPKLIGRSGTNHAHVYALAPDGQQDRTQQLTFPFDHPTETTTAPGTGVVGGKVELLHDSFTYPAARYLAAGFADVTMVTYGSLGKYQAEVVNSLIDKQVIAVEVVERNVAGGDAALLDPGVVTQIAQVLAQHPMR
ncbi:alginate O-acetyltransferase AlgX-related protein [Gandjariella thermophila]|uniref:AlgX/AlgJ SGNH hydrolase-like domain-containing protein n=1 Tax=Gandjariella thermophila TaxID=1931992 RepID=A0A4D4J5R8_9PSEU|nr:hypothetical protein [Gandjariella thermophila]GDY30804.1 hypothetical protein GTS_24370 [Gandjariella thermophila]